MMNCFLLLPSIFEQSTEGSVSTSPLMITMITDITTITDFKMITSITKNGDVPQEFLQTKARDQPMDSAMSKRQGRGPHKVNKEKKSVYRKN